MKFLCVCEGGNVRSHALAYVLHDLLGQEAVACGWRRVSAESLDHFCEWADFVVVMQEIFVERIPERYRKKVRVLDVGPDRFGIYIHPELLAFVKGAAQDWAARDWKI